MSSPAPERFTPPLHRATAALAACLMGLLATGPTHLLAQEFPDPVVDIPAPPMPGAESVAANPADEPLGDTVTVLADGQPLEAFILQYQKLTGNIVIQDSQLDTGLAITFNVPIDFRPTRAEYVELIEKTLLLNGFVFVPAGERTVKMLNWNAKNPGSQGVPIYTSPEQIPAGETVATYFMTFDHINVNDAQNIFANAILASPYTMMVPAPNVNALIIRENTVNIRRLIELKPLIDQPSAGVTTEFVKLFRADAERVAETITNLIEESAQQDQGTGAAISGVPQQQQQQQDPNAPPQPVTTNVSVNVNSQTGGANVLLSERGLFPGVVKLVPDLRTNSILVVTRPTNIPRIRELIARFDRPSELALPFERQLYYRKPTELLPVLVDVLAETEEDAGASGVASPTGGGVSNLSGGAGTGANRGRGTGGGSIGGGATGGGGGGAGALALSAPAEEQAPSSAVVGKTLLIADDRSNSILISGPAENVEKAVQIIDSLDMRPRQVYFSSVIGQLSLSDGFEYGVSYLQRFQEIRANGETGGIASSLVTGNPPIGAGTGTGENATPGGFIDAVTLQQPGDFLNRSGLLVYGTIADSLDVYVNALESTTRFKTLARPTVYTANNKRAYITSGQRIAVPTNTVSNLTGDTSTAVSSSISFEEVALTLEIIPLINANKEVTLEINQVNDNVLGSQIISGNEVPNIATQQLQTTVTVPNKSIVVLGGLITENEENNRVGLPLLGRIPVLGNLFSSKRKVTSRSELIVMIQPTVIEDESDLYYKSYREEANTDIGGAAHEHLQGRTPDIRRAEPVYRQYDVETEVERTEIIRSMK